MRMKLGPWIADKIASILTASAAEGLNTGSYASRIHGPPWLSDGGADGVRKGAGGENYGVFFGYPTCAKK